MRKRFAPDLCFLVIPELHTKNVDTLGYCWHFHVLLANTGNISFTFSHHIDKKSQKPIYNVGNWHWGFSTAIKIGDDSSETQKLSIYVLKYITKQTHLLTKGRHRYYVSNNLPKPEVTTYYVDPKQLEEEINIVADSLGKNIAYISEKKGYYNIKYIELQ